MVYIQTDFLGPHCGTIVSTQKVSLYCRKLFVYVWLTLWVKKLVPQCGIKLLTNRFHIVEQLPRPRKSVRFLQFHNLEPVCLYIVVWFHIAEPICFYSLVWFHNVEPVFFGSTLWNQSVSTLWFGSTLQNQFVSTVWFGSTMWNHIPQVLVLIE